MFRKAFVFIATFGLTLTGFAQDYVNENTSDYCDSSSFNAEEYCNSSYQDYYNQPQSYSYHPYYYPSYPYYYYPYYYPYYFPSNVIISNGHDENFHGEQHGESMGR
jgi:hypothetical protein